MVQAYKKRGDKLSFILSLVMASSGIWSFFYGVEIAAKSLAFIKICIYFEYAGIVTIAVFWFVFALLFTGNERFIPSKIRFVLYIIPFVNFIAVLTNDFHHLFYKSSKLSYFFGYYFHDFIPGPFYYVHVIYSYTLILVGIFLVVRMYSRVPSQSKLTVSYILIGVSIPCIISLLYVLGYKPLGFVDLTPIGFLSMGIVLLIGVFNNNLLDIKPLALNVLFDSMQDSLFVLNLKNEITNTNPAAKKLLDSNSISEKSYFNKIVVDHFLTGFSEDDDTEKELSIGDRVYSLTLNAVNDQHNNLRGKTLILHDITKRKRALTALKEREEQFKELTEIFPEVIYEADMEGNITYINEHGIEKFGLKYAEAKGLNLYDFVIENEKQKVSGRIQERLRGERGTFHEYKVVLNENDTFDALAYTANIVKNGVVTGIRGFLLDITERKRIEASLRESEINFRTFFETMNDMIFICDLERHIFFSNKSVFNKLGYSPNELNGLKICDLVEPENRTEAYETLLEILEGKKEYCTIPFVRKDGKLLIVETHVWLGKWDGMDCLFAISKDFTNERAALQKFNKIFESNPTLMTLNNFGDRRITEVNGAFLKKTGYKREECIGKTFSELNLWCDQGKIKELYDKLMDTGHVSDEEISIYTKTGEKLNILFSSEIIETSDTRYYLLVMSDITEQKQVLNLQQLLVNIADKYINAQLDTLDDTINESLMDIGLFVNADRSYIFDYEWENNTCRNTYEWCNEGIKPEIVNLQKVPLEWLSSWVKAHKQNQPVFIQDVLSLPEHDNLRHLLESQEIKSLLTIPLMNAGSCDGFVGFDSVRSWRDYNDKERILLQGFAQMIVNLNNHKRASELLHNQLRVQQLINEISAELVSVDNQNINDKIMKLLQLTGEFFGVDRSYILRYSDDGKYETNTHEWCAIDIVPQKDTIINVRLDDFPWWKSQIQKKKIIYIRNLDELPENAALERTDFIRQGIRTLLCFPILNNNSLIGYFGFDSVNNERSWTGDQIDVIKTLSNILSDALIRVETEKELIRSKELAESASIAKSEFLSNMSHEIRTPLNGVIGFTDLLRNTSLSSIQKDYLDNAITSANSLLGVISDILDFSKIEMGKLELEIVRTDIIQLFENAIDIVKVHASTKGLELLLNIQPDLARFAWVDPIRLKQILVNLMGNAVKFTSVGEVELRVDFALTGNGKGKYNISIRDTGIGIREEQKDKLFKAFSQADTSTTRRYGGTGLGLIISNSLAQKMGSNIVFESTYEIGSTFSFDIETEYEFGAGINDVDSLSHLKNILIIDDNKNNRTILEHTFSHWGIRSVSCENGPSAINMITSNKDICFDLIIVDYHMPYLNGIDTIKIMRDMLQERSHAEPVILLHSSLDDAEVHEKAHRLQVNYLLTKPVKADELYHYLVNLKNVTAVSKKMILQEKSDLDQFIFKSDHQLTILVAEDTKMNMILITKILKDMIPGVNVVEAENGEEACEKILNEHIDLILMDVQMPVLDGIGATARIRKISNFDSIPVIALSAGVTKEERQKCFDAGMNDFLAKPVHKTDLMNVLIKYLNISEVQMTDNMTNIVDGSIHFGKKVLLDKTGNNADILQSMLQLARSEFPKLIDEMDEAVTSGNAEKIKRIAHKLKGSAYNMEFKILGDLAHDIELTADNPASIPQLIVQLKNEWNEILGIMDN
jgi:PAS domain S-box-containing protein